ncbi:hypothetical protein B0H14DRAFT_2581758 [Mycena olivaceomarginata]|nr:hypothetical protein B0H14DRAFT_2581758 [Mycena olivaceomarginata]
MLWKEEKAFIFRQNILLESESLNTGQLRDGATQQKLTRNHPNSRHTSHGWVPSVERSRKSSDGTGDGTGSAKNDRQLPIPTNGRLGALKTRGYGMGEGKGVALRYRARP